MGLLGSSNSMGLLSKLTRNAGNAASGGTSGSANNRSVTNQYLGGSGATSLDAANLTPLSVINVPAYYDLSLTSLKISLAVTDTTGGTTAPAGVTAIETALKQFYLQTNDGRNVYRLDGSLFDISNVSRYLNPSGTIANSGKPADSATSTSYTSNFDIIIPFALAKKWLPAKLFVVYNTLGSRASTLNSMTSTATLSVYGNYHNVNVVDQAINAISVPVAAAGDLALNQYYHQGRTYYNQFLSYGDVQESDAADTFIGTTGTGITFTHDGSLEISNAPIQNFIDQENTAYPNTVSAGVGHEAGLINLFTRPFKATAASQLNVDFTATPKVAGNTDTCRFITVENLV